MANNNPIFIGSPDIQWGAADGNAGTAGPLKTANTNFDGTGTVLTVFTADATNGGFVQKLTVKAAGTNIQTVLRVFVNNGSTNATIANNVLIKEFTIPATTASANSALPDFEIPLNIPVPLSYKINVTVGTTISAGVFVSGIGGKY